MRLNWVPVFTLAFCLVCLDLAVIVPVVGAQTKAEVAIADFKFAPEAQTAAPGATVTWTNKDPAAHMIKFDDQASTALANGASYSRTFDQPGEYAYRCGIHSYITGKIVVKK